MALKKKKFLLLCIFLIAAFLLVEITGVISNSTNISHTPQFSDSNLSNKLGSNLQVYLSFSENIDIESIRIIVVFDNKNSVREGIIKINSLSLQIQLIQQWQLIPAAVFDSPAMLIEQIANFSEVKRIWLDQRFAISKLFNQKQETGNIAEIDSPSENVPLNSKNSNNYSQIYNGTNVIVALLDTGVDITHDDLENSILAFGGVSLVDGDPFPMDLHGHGTFCAGIITGDGVVNDSFKGVAPGVDILNIKVLNNLGIGLWSWIISGIEYAIIHGADIIAMCFSMPGYPGDPVNLAIDAAIKRGMIVVTAVGDDGPAYSSVGAPGMSQGAITVGAYNDFTHEVASFSGRGPTLSFHTKPDIVASGVNITSCRPILNLTKLLQGSLSINLTSILQPDLNYGQNISNHYTVVNSTSAAAANVTGVIATLVQHSKFLTAEEIKIILKQTATPILGVGHNVQGAGLVNFTAAHAYLVQNNLNDTLIESRIYTPNLFSPWAALSHNSTRDTTLFVTHYGTLLLMLDSYQNSTLTHMIQGQLAVKYNNQIKWLSDMHVLRELHNLTSDFSIIQSVITDYSLIYVFTLEGSSSTNGFRVNLTLINLESAPIHNITLFSVWNTNLYWNQSASSSGDSGQYNTSEDIIYVYDSANGNSSYIGFTGRSNSLGHEINSSSNIRNQIQAGTLQNNSIYSGNDSSIAMEWFITPKLNNTEFSQFSQYIGIGNSFNDLNNSIQTMRSQLSSENMTNLALLSSNLSRIGFVGQSFTSNVLLMNIGNVAVNNSFVAFLINSTDTQTQTFFSKYINLGRLEPFEFKWVNVTWNPTDVDIYSSYWVVGTGSMINELILYFMNITVEITEEQNFLDNFYIRNIFIKNNLHKLHNIFPTTIPLAPQLIYFPSDIAIFNISITTNHLLTNLKIQILEGNIPTNWISYQIPSNLHSYGSLQVTLAIPQDPKVGSYNQKLNITADNFHIGEVWVNFSIQYPSGRVLFYKPALNFSFQSTIQIENLANIWNERLDTIYSGYFEFFNLCLQNNYDVDDFGLFKQFYPNISLDTVISLPFELPYPTDTLQQNMSFLSNYDLVILCDPETNLSQAEIDALVEFGLNGGSIFLWVEPETECEQSSINSILNPFGIQIYNSSSTSTELTFSNPEDHEVSSNLTQIGFYSFTTFQNTSKQTIFLEYNTEATFILNDTFGKILGIGDSSLFNDSHIAKLDNFHLLNNSINWLMKEKINITLIINSNKTSPLRINQHLSISIHLTSINGTDLSQNLTLFTYLITPSNKTLYMIFFGVQDGWYNSLYLDSWLNETGTYFLIIYADNISLISSYEVQQFELLESLPPEEDPTIDRSWISFLQLTIGAIIAGVLSLIIIGIILYQRRQWHRKMTIVELKEKMQREISNLLSEYHVYVRELEELLQKSKVLDPDKLRIILDKQERKKNLLKQLRKLGKKV